MAYVPKGKPVDVVLNKTSDLTKLLKSLKNEEAEIVAFLADVYKNDKNDIQVRLKAAQTLLDKRISVSESVAKESITKIMLSQKLSGNSLMQQNSPSKPLAVVDFNSIQRVDGIEYEELDRESNTFDLGDVKSFT